MSWLTKPPKRAPTEDELVRALQAASGALVRVNRTAAESHLALMIDAVRSETGRDGDGPHDSEQVFLTSFERRLKHGQARREREGRAAQVRAEQASDATPSIARILTALEVPDPAAAVLDVARRVGEAVIAGQSVELGRVVADVALAHGAKSADVLALGGPALVTL